MIKNSLSLSSTKLSIENTKSAVELIDVNENTLGGDHMSNTYTQRYHSADTYKSLRDVSFAYFC